MYCERDSAKISLKNTLVISGQGEAMVTTQLSKVLARMTLPLLLSVVLLL